MILVAGLAVAGLAGIAAAFYFSMRPGRFPGPGGRAWPGRGQPGSGQQKQNLSPVLGPIRPVRQPRALGQSR